ncbi:MAG: phage tail tape measure protein [Verrucomicrobiales bacterium]
MPRVANAAGWMAAFAVAGAGVKAVRKGVEAMIDLEHATERLKVVFRGGRTEATLLGRDVLSLAAANGRGAQEAMEAAIAWSRLGLTKLQVLEAVRVSLMAANVAEITAGEATEHLSSLMATYKLSVTQLSSELAGLNAISNRYNVTNKDMLEGLTRTAAIAKQAGISLAELKGFIGAGVSVTGQTGPNIGQGVKSIIGSLSQERVQKDLREDFQFETTTDGGDGLKNMSQLLSELFVKYQAMSEAERRTMLFNVAGKHQASRMAALLDGYIRAQILAINATNDLTSAEAENKAITETLRSTYAGLVTEFQSFAFKQGSNGPAQALGEIGKAMQNVLKIANTSGGSIATSGLMLLLGALTGRLALTGVALGKTGGVKTGAFASVANAAKNLRASLDSALVVMPRWAQGIAGMGAASQAAAAKVGLMRGALALSLASLVQFLPWLAAIGAATWGFNKGMDALSGVSEATSGKLDEYSKSAERAARASESAALTARLFATTQEALKNTASPAAQRDLLNQVAEAAFPTRANMSDAEKAEAERKTADLKTWYAEKIQLGDMPSVQMDLKGRSIEAIKQQAAARQREYENLAKQEQVYQERIKEIQTGVVTGGMTAKAKKESIADIQGRIAELKNQRVKMTVEDIESNEASSREWFDSDLRHLSLMERQKAILTEISDIYSQMPKSGRVDMLNSDIARLTEERDLHEQTYRWIKKQLSAQQAAGNDTRTKQEIDAEITSRRTSVMAENEKVTTSLGSIKATPGIGYAMGASGAMPAERDLIGGLKDEKGNWSEEKIKAFQVTPEGERYKVMLEGVLSTLQKIRQEEIELARLEQRSATEGAEKTFTRLKLQMDESRKAAEQAQSQLNGIASPEVMRAAERADGRQFAKRYFTAQAQSYAVGDGSGEQFVNQRNRMALEVEEAETRIGLMAKGSLEVDNLRVKALEYRVKLTEGLIEGEERLLQLSQEEHNVLIQKNREYQRGLLTAGPGELLRKLAVNQLSKSNRSAGGFFALSSEGRQDFLSRPENDEQLRQIRRDQAALRGAGFGRQMENNQSRFVTEQMNRGQAYRQLGSGVEINKAATEAASSLTGLKAASTSLAASFNRLAMRVDTLFAIRSQTGAFDAQASAAAT